jgi:hypothetical protein
LHNPLILETDLCINPCKMLKLGIPIIVVSMNMELPLRIIRRKWNIELGCGTPAKSRTAADTMEKRQSAGTLQ